MDRLTYLIILNLINFIHPSYVKSRDKNIVNKGVWVKKEVDRKNSDFIFGNSLDMDMVERNFDAFGDDDMQSTFLSNFGERSKRSSNNNLVIENHQNKCKDKSKCLKTEEKVPSTIKSKLLSTLKPASVFNAYPFEVAVLLNNNIKDIKNNNSSENIKQYKARYFDKDTRDDVNVQHFPDINRNTEDLSKDSYITFTEKIKEMQATDKMSMHSNKTLNKSLSAPTKTTTNQSKVLQKIKLLEEYNGTQIIKVPKNRNVFDKENMAWQNSAPISGNNAISYRVSPKSKEKINARINERGLIKVLTMLTKTFKKIMKQHSDIKRIHNKLYNLNDDFVNNVELLTKKFEDFNKKYSQMMKVSETLNHMETKLRDKEINFDKREKDLSKNLLEFENQQKKFLSQQRQFYNMQKAMLEQNEKISSKQIMIAKTQSEISHRQNNFARILKKAKQIYMDPRKLDTSFNKQKVQDVTVAPKTSLPTTESIKINLFSIPTASSIKNQDQLILDEKDSQPVDDLVYKYYFNNTFFDDVMKNKILAAFVTSESTNNNGTKNKRNEIKLKSTVLYPVNKNNKFRQRRWIRNKKTNKKDKHTDKATIINNLKDNVIDDKELKQIKNKNDPFMVMAFNFCQEIGQNSNTQITNWCIEKALRRLQIIDFKNSPSVTPNVQRSSIPNDILFETTTPLSPSSSNKTPSTVTAAVTSNIFFPDNDDLESKLKEYELQPDTEGTVYYDGSLHSSDLGHIVNVDSEGFSDIMPGLDSDSRIQLEPLALDLQAQRRADVRRINARITGMRMV